MEDDAEMEGLDEDQLDEKMESEEDEDLEDGLDDSLDEGLDDEIAESKPEAKMKESVESKSKSKTKSKTKTVSASESSKRTYRISITYDFYYNTPRMWIQGSTEEGVPLTEAEIYEDIMSDYKGKTVTMEKHPHLGSKLLLIMMLV